MLNIAHRAGPATRRAAHHSQRGIVLILALIVLAAMTLAGIGLMRSVFTGNRVAGNLAFQQAATHSADAGIEAAIAWLEANNADVTNPLFQDKDVGGVNLGYFASKGNPVNQSWEQWWNGLPAGRINTRAPDAAGNTVAFVIHRLCNATGDPSGGAACDASPTVVGAEGGSRGSGVLALAVPSQRYYRVTVRVTGPRNTVSFVQSVVAM